MASNEISIATYLPAVTYAKALDVIQLVSQGNTVLQACEIMVISVAQFRAACKREPALQTMLAEAEELCDDILADLLLDPQKWPTDHKFAGVYASNIKFILERRRPAKYGKVAETINPESDQNRLLAEALRAAIDRIPAPVQVLQQITDANFTVVDKKEASAVTPTPSIEGDTSDNDDGLAELRRLGFL